MGKIGVVTKTKLDWWGGGFDNFEVISVNTVEL